MRSKQYAPAQYDAVAAVYDQRWQRDHADTLDRTARYVTSVPATAAPGTFPFDRNNPWSAFALEICWRSKCSSMREGLDFWCCWRLF